MNWVGGWRAGPSLGHVALDRGYIDIGVTSFICDERRTDVSYIYIYIYICNINIAYVSCMEGAQYIIHIYICVLCTRHFNSEDKNVVVDRTAAYCFFPRRSLIMCVRSIYKYGRTHANKSLI